MAPAGDVRAELFHRTTDGALRQGARDRRRHGAARRLRGGGPGRARPVPLLGLAGAAGHRLELQLHRRDGDGHRLPHPGRAQQGAGHERFLRLRRHGGRVVPRGIDPAQLGLAGGQLDDLPGPGADPGAAAVAGRAKAGAASSGLIGAVQEALRAVGRLGRYSTCFHWRSLDSASS